MKSQVSILLIILTIVSLFLLSTCAPDDNSRGTSSDGDTDGDSDGDTDGDSDGDTDGDSDGGSDSGSDPYNPLDPTSDCDCPDLSDDGAENFAKAMNICPDNGLNSSETFSSHADGPTVGMEILDHQGNNDCLQKQHGCKMFAMSTGLVGNPNPNIAEGMFGAMGTEPPIVNDPMPEFQGDMPSGDGSQKIFDLNQLKVNLTAPDGAQGFAFDFLYASAEYNEWVHRGFNDTFYAILEHPSVNGGATTNISFDSNNNEIEVDTNFFENDLFPCDESGSGWEPEIPGEYDPNYPGRLISGSTGWLRTTYPVKGGDTFTLTFSIHDEGDGAYDSIVFLDNFQWLGSPVTGDTVPIE